MESLENNNQNSLSVNENGKRHLAEGLKWSRILAVVGIILLGLGILGSLFGIIGMIAGTGRYGYYGVSFIAVIQLLITLVFYGLYLIPTISFLKFTTIGKQSLASSNPVTLAEAFDAFKKAMKFYGILMFIQIGLGILVAIIGALAFTAGGFDF